MSRKWFGTGALGLACMLLFAHPASAGFTLDAGGGASIPLGDFSDIVHAKTGFQIAGAVDYRLNDLFAVGVDASWNQSGHSLEGKSVVLSSGVTRTYNKDDKFKTWQLGARGTYFVPVGGSVRPFVRLGAGVYNTTETLDRTDTVGGSSVHVTGDLSTDPRFGYMGGVGGILKANELVSVELEGDYHLVPQDKLKAGTDTLSSIGVTLSLVFDLMK